MTEDSFERVKRLMKIVGGKAIIVEDGKPSFVIINADEYLNFENVKESVNSETELVEKINKDITIWKNKQKEKELRQMEKNFAKKENVSREVEIVPNDISL
ncbi:MAG: hypothetical protein WC178_02030 [Candidatus Paceibacterota bacterium]